MFKSVLILIFLLYFYASICKANCNFKMERINGFNPIVKTDENGKKCRGDILLPFCVGVCKSEESGTYLFPFREREATACILIGNELKNISFSDCDEGASESIRYLTISASTKCGCQPIPRKN
ncbi:Cys-knot domain-containing protein [Aphelenchoides bicaudatus]|nr:Cys-knot domain-containing protein [Aphelenchoides bicaudatus]